MRPGGVGPILSYDLRLPNEAQADALRLLDASRAVVNATLTALWEHLDVFATIRDGNAWKQVGKHIGSPDPHGDRQWRCESETVGRILRAQATRKQAFALIQPILTDGFIWPKTERKPAGKNRRAIRDALTALKQVQQEGQNGQDGGEATFVALQNVIEQACNFYFANDRFPATYEEIQPIPVLEVGLLTYAGDDGPEKGQAYRLRVDNEAGEAAFRFRRPDAQGIWGWRAEEVTIPLPQRLREQLSAGEWQAPTLREERTATGQRYAVLDIPVAVEPATALPPWESVERVLGADWGVHTLLTATAVDAESQQIGRPFFLNTGGFDGRQARTRRQIDELNAKRDRFQHEYDALPTAPPDPSNPNISVRPLDSIKAARYTQRIARIDGEIARCWRKYDLRNRMLAHLAANVLLLLCQVHDCSLLTVESLKTLKTTGRGKGVKGRWRNYRNNTTIRGEIWRLLKYKCWLSGVRFHIAKPNDTSHTCPRCAKSALTYRSPQDAQEAQSGRPVQKGHEAVHWGRWLRCAACDYGADRDYAASVNIARLGVATLRHRQATGVGHAFAISDPVVKPIVKPITLLPLAVFPLRLSPQVSMHITVVSGVPDKPAPYTDAGSALLLPPTGHKPAQLRTNHPVKPVKAVKRVRSRGTITYLAGWTRTVFLQSSLPRAAFLRLRTKRPAA
jgi:hypothetical protein